MSSFYKMFEYTADAVFGTDKNGCIRFWNKACEELLGISSKHAIGKHCFDIFCANDLMGNKFCSQQCQISKNYDECSSNNNWDLLIKQKNGEYVVVNVGSYYTNNLNGEEHTDISVFHSMRLVNCHQLIKRLAVNLSMASDDNVHRLSKREMEVLRLITFGINTKNIAIQLDISHATARNHIKNIYTKLEVHSRAEAINYAMQHALF